MHASEHKVLVAMPAPLRLVRDICLHLGEAVIVPVALFYIVLVTVGMHTALLAALAWAYTAVAVRLLRGGRPPVLLVVGTLMATVQVVITGISNDAVLYFVQPTVTTFLFGAALLATVTLERPLIQRLATEFCPMPPAVIRSVPLRRFFQRLSLLWAAVLISNAAVTIGLLLTIPVTASVPISMVASAPLFLVGLLASWKWFHRSLHAGGFTLAWGAAPTT